jgi:hypothetical protein
LLKAHQTCAVLNQTVQVFLLTTPKRNCCADDERDYREAKENTNDGFLVFGEALLNKFEVVHETLLIALIADKKANDEADYDTGNAYDKRQTRN